MLLYYLDLAGVAVFAVSGVLAARDRGLDFFGVIVVAAITGVGGGTLRDLLLDRHPIFWVTDTWYLVVIIASAVATVVYVRARPPPGTLLLVADAFGLALFALSGAQTAEAAQCPPLIVVLMGTMTGVTGGVLRDVITAQVPLILRREIYALAAIAGIAAYLALHALGMPRAPAFVTGMILVVVLRLLAIRWSLHLPVFGKSWSEASMAAPRMAHRVPVADPERHGHPHGGHPAGAHAAHESHAHDRHAGHSAALFRDKFWLTLALTVPILVWGHMLPRLFGYAPPHLPASQWITPLLGTAVFFYGGWPFVKGAARELRDRLPGMMTLIALAITVAFIFSAAVTLGFPGMPLWEELATLVSVMLLGHWLEMRSISQAQGALGELAKLLPDRAARVRGEEIEEVPVSELRDGDLVLIRPGARIPADGIVRSGESGVDEALITGESAPVKKHPGAKVIAGTVNGGGSLRAEVTGTGERTALAGIMRLVEKAQASRSRAQALADRAARWLTWIALIAGGLTLGAWLLAGATGAVAVERLVTVLVIACPHALGLAVPLVLAISTTLGARSGLLVRDRRGLEEARNLTTVVFDKTGTLTLGEHRVVAAHSKEMPEHEALRLAAAVERDAEHPVAHAIVKSAAERGVAVPPATSFEAIPGRGARAVVEGRGLAVGGPNLLQSTAAKPCAELERFAQEAASRGQGVVYLLEGSRPLSAFAVADAVRPESAEAVRRLHEAGIEVVMMTGDARAVAGAVARELGIDSVLAEVLPQDKAANIERLQRQGKRVAMVGDGVNDAPALVTANVGIAIGAGTDVAVEAGDIVLVRSDPRDVPRIINLSRATYRKMVQNLWWAAGYNIFAIPLAAGVLAPWGVLLTPAAGAVLMSLSTIIVAINAQLLRRARL